MARYPMDAFSKVSVYLLIFALPASAVTTIPSRMLIEPLPVVLQPFLIFSFLSFIFILVVRLIWLRALRTYTSSN